MNEIIIGMTVTEARLCTHGLIIPFEWAKVNLAYKIIPLTGPFDL
jgi:hypothetical protein